MAKETSPAPAKSGQAKTRGTTKAKATETAKPDEIVAGAAPTAAAPVDPAATVAGSTQIQDGAPAGSTSTDSAPQDGAQPPAGSGDSESAGTTAASVETSATASGEGSGEPSGDASGVTTPADPSAPAGASGDEGNDDDAGDEPADDALPEQAVSSSRLVNHSNQTHRIVKARISLEPGESAVVEFRDDKHREQCEKHVAQIRSLNRWREGEGLHWSLAE